MVGNSSWLPIEEGRWKQWCHPDLVSEFCSWLRFLRRPDVIEVVLLDFNNEDFSASVDAAGLVEAPVLVTTGLIASSVAGQAVRWCDCSLP